jgi:hypothetical protein
MATAVCSFFFVLLITTASAWAGNIDTNDIIDGAVIDAKITGPISASKVEGGLFQKKSPNVVVAAQGGDNRQFLPGQIRKSG